MAPIARGVLLSAAKQGSGELVSPGAESDMPLSDRESAEGFLGY